MVDDEFIADESSLRPKAGDRVLVGSTDLDWTPIEVSDGVIDVNVLIGQKVEHSVAYALCYLDSDNPQSELRLMVGSDDQAKVYLNGKEVFRSLFRRGFLEDEDVVENLKLRSGRNVLIFKIVNGSADWQGSIRLTGANGRPVQGLHTGLVP